MNSQSISQKAKLMHGMQFAAICLLFAGFLFGYISEAISAFFYFLMLICCLIASGIRKNLRKSSMACRKEIVMNTLRPDRYEPDKHVSEEVVRLTGFYPKWTTIKGSDLVETVYRGIPLTFCDLELSHSTGRSHTTDFYGTFIILDCDREIQHAVVIREGESSPRKIETESMEFNDRFCITADDLTEAMYVLTPHFMEKLIQADEYAKAKTCMKFVGKQVFIALHNYKNLFEFGNAENMYEYACLCEKDAAYIQNYIDILIENTALFDQNRITQKNTA